MEKFAVDLDKVLDDFEYNEEQAVRPSQYLRSELPAKKYQRPPFQRINIEDADYSPSKQTSSPVIPYIAPQAAISHASSILGSPSGEPSLPIDNLSDPEIKIDFENVPSAIEVVEETLSVPDLLENDKSSEEGPTPLKLPDVTEIAEVISNDGVLTQLERLQCDLLVDNTEVTVEAEEVTEESLPFIESFIPEEPIIEEQASVALDSEIIVNESMDMTETVDVSNISYHNPSIVEELERENELKRPILETEKVFVENEEKETTADEVREVSVSEKDENGNEASVSNVVMEEYRTEDVNDKDKVNDVDALIRESVEEKVVPVKFEADVDIPDEELEGFLEQLEEAEQDEVGEVVLEKEIVEKDKQEEEELQDTLEAEEEIIGERPQRPSYLDLTITGPEEPGAPGSTPPAKESTVISEDQDNEINERGEACGESKEMTTAIPEEISEESVREEVPPSPDSPQECFFTIEELRLGKVSPFWIPDSDAQNCMHCGLKFNLIKRRHHCRGCGRVLCGKCCGMRATLEYLGNQQNRVCEPCFRTLSKVMLYEAESDSEVEVSPRRRPNPNNPMEYCSKVPPPLQASPSGSQPPPSVLVPVLKRAGSTKAKEHHKKVMFSDGIRPGGDLTSLDDPPPSRSQRGPHVPKRVGTPPGSVVPSPVRLLPPVDPTTQSFIINKSLPPLCQTSRGHTTYQEPLPWDQLKERLRSKDLPPLLFAVNRHLFVSLKIVQLDCCNSNTCWVFSTRGMLSVGQDEVMVLLQTTGDDEEPVPVDVFLQLHFIYQAADKGELIRELGYWGVKAATFLDSRYHGGFLFVRPTFQCVQNLDLPVQPYLVAILIHRLELPWARLFPLRLMLRLGAEFRYYPCRLVSVRNREPVYYEIGDSIIKVLADFLSYTYTLPEVQGLRIHMEEQLTSILLPKNRYDQVVSALNKSTEPVLPFAGSFSPDADSHLVCMQSKGDEIKYHTQSINISDKPRKVTGASFVLLNASLKSTEGVLAKRNMVEDGVFIQISLDTMAQLRGKLRSMEDWSVKCGANDEEVIQIVWCEDDRNFNKGVKSHIDGMAMDGIPSIRVHNGTDYMCSSRFIRWTEVFIIKCEDGATSAKIGDPLEINRLAEAIARGTCTALTKAKLLDHLAAEDITTLALRATVTQDQVCYEAGGNGRKLEAVFMNSLDNELIPVLHSASAINTDSLAILELVFHILDQ